MNILFAAAEVAPFIKTGGLADVAGSLPTALAQKGHDVRVILPLYEGVSQQWRDQMTFLKYYFVKVSWRNPYCGLFELKKDGVTYYFVDNEYYFRRAQLYGHYDDGERFAFFSRAVIETPAQVGFWPDIIHCNDWQTAPVPVYLLEEKYKVPELGNAKSVYTIHNIEYQGRFSDHILEDIMGLDRSYFNTNMLAYYGEVNWMQGGIHAADFVTTVSPTYAEELGYSFYAHGLEGVVNANRHKVRGILNGIDVELYDPSKDNNLVKNFSPDDMEGKKVCKTALQRAVGLNEDPSVPILACVSRLVSHKGFDLVRDAVHELMDMDIQVVILGTGDWHYEQVFRQAAAQYPGRFSAQIMYSGALSAAIYAGADLFLMPSVSEPCGLSQMIAMRNGTLPIVRETGGLRDTVRPYDQNTGEGNGFSFSNINRHEMVDTVRRAVELYYNDPAAFDAMRKTAMTDDFSWTASAEAYLSIYRELTGGN